jgi:hypothetical protein
MGQQLRDVSEHNYVYLTHDRQTTSSAYKQRQQLQQQHHDFFPAATAFQLQHVFGCPLSVLSR